MRVSELRYGMYSPGAVSSVDALVAGEENSIDMAQLNLDCEYTLSFGTFHMIHTNCLYYAT